MKKALNEFSVWQEAESKLTKLKTELNAVEAAYLDRTAAINRKSDKLTAEAQAFIDGKEPPEHSATQQELDNLDRRKQIIRRAIELHREQMAQIRGQLSKEICQALRPEYRRLIREIARHAAALAQAQEEEEKFRRTLIDGDVSFVGWMPPVFVRGLGKLGDDYGRVNQFFREAASAGYITESEKEVVSQ